MSGRKYEAGTVKQKKALDKEAREKRGVACSSKMETFFHCTTVQKQKSKSPEPESQVECEIREVQNQEPVDLEPATAEADVDTKHVREQAVVDLPIVYETDLGLWKTVSSNMLSYFISAGGIECQHKDEGFLL